MLSEEEYKAHINSIENKEVPEIIFSVLCKVSQFLENRRKLFSESERIRQNLFNSFFKQYNTILALSQKTQYVFNPDISYLDIRSINILIRSAHEIYLVHHYLVSDGMFGSVNSVDERAFKYLIYKLSGELSQIRTLDLYKELKYKPDNTLDLYEAATTNKNEVLQKISSFEIYKNLPKELKKKIKSGEWRVNSERTLSWSDLAELTPMVAQYGKLEYHHLSQYTHMTYASQVLEANHNQDIDGLLCHLYILASLFSFSVISSYNMIITKDDILTKREQSLIIEFLGLASNR
ncbi:hypothetical protein [Aeromonas veronii]|uniref:hypothetical protein n=1 Tax=Aeromonas veronii TaxID=654 RepID=UPI001F17F4F3|nr:hypothetical protein [Aeromonas veronii]MCF5850189.1 hypothetical protein [Aeromonas veronii]